MSDPLTNFTEQLQRIMRHLPTEPAPRQAASSDGLVTIDAGDPSHIRVTIARQLLPNPQDRAAVEQAISEAVSALLGATDPLPEGAAEEMRRDADTYFAEGTAHLEAAIREADQRFDAIKGQIASRMETEG